MATLAAYDEIADWYEQFMLGGNYGRHVDAMLDDLLPPGAGGACLDVCCGTGLRAQAIARRGWWPVGIDLSTEQLRYGQRRETVIVGDAAALPIAEGSLDAAVCVLGHTDVPDYAAVVREVARVLRPGATFVHIGVHPCFCSYAADWSQPGRLVIGRGYGRRQHSFDTWTEHGVRARVGAWHHTLADLLNAAAGAGLRITRTVEAGDDPPSILGFAATA
jgi:SAM-dependent methyltransferase